MRLPNHQSALVPRRKLTHYLLSPTHRAGKHKAAFFTRFGFSAADWLELEAALLRHAATHDVTEIVPSPFGTRYVVDGIMVVPDGREPVVRAVWFIETGGTVPRLVTAYPLERRSR